MTVLVLIFVKKNLHIQVKMQNYVKKLKLLNNFWFKLVHKNVKGRFFKLNAALLTIKT